MGKRRAVFVPERQWIISVTLPSGQEITISRYAPNADEAEKRAKVEFKAERAVCRSEFRGR